MKISINDRVNGELASEGIDEVLSCHIKTDFTSLEFRRLSYCSSPATAEDVADFQGYVSRCYRFNVYADALIVDDCDPFAKLIALELKTRVANRVINELKPRNHNKGKGPRNKWGKLK